MRHFAWGVCIAAGSGCESVSGTHTAVRARVGLHRHACRECGLHADLAAQIGSHQFFDGFFRVTAAEEVVQFGESGFGGHVAAANGAGCVQMAEEFLTAMVQ